MRVKVENEEIFNADVATLNADYKKHGLVPQTSYVSVIFDKTRRGSDMLPMMRKRTDGSITRVSSLLVDFAIGSAASFPVITEVYGLRD